MQAWAATAKLFIAPTPSSREVLPTLDREEENMPSFEQHCAESIQLFGKPYGEIHRWRTSLQVAHRTG